MAIATLIAAGRLDERLVERIPGARLVGWIEPGSAADVAIDGDAGAIKASLLRLDRVDFALWPGERTPAGLLVADMDSTMIGQECIDELADYAGFKDRVAAITERAMQGELDFASALRERVALLEGLDESVIQQCLAERIRPNPGAATLVRTMQARGTETILVSGGFTAFVAPIAAEIGFDRFEANVLGTRDGRLTGLTEGPVVDSRRKHDVLVEARDRLGLSSATTMAIGDGANDISMVEAAGLGVAYRAKPALAAVADARLDHHGLDALLWMQGIPRSEWAEA